MSKASRTRSKSSNDREAGGRTPRVTADGRQLRRERNREAVVEALLDLYSEGTLMPSAEQIAVRSGLSPRSLFRYFNNIDDLAGVAVERQRDRVLPLLPFDATPDAPLAAKVAALVEQRFRLFAATGNAATVSRLRAPFQSLIATELTRNRAFLRLQIATLFAPELTAMGAEAGAGALAVADVLSSYESYVLLLKDQALSTEQAKSVLSDALTAVLGRPVRSAAR